MKTSGNPSLLKIILLMLMFVSYSDTYVFSKPRGGQVVSGTASFTQDGNLTVITAGNRSVINFTGFDIAKGETVQFVQPNAHSTVLNRVTTADPTNIFGTLQANGIVVIANPYGVFFQNGSVVNVGGLIAGAGQVSAAEFTKGKVHFTDLNGDVRNDGVIAADNRIALMGANVVNTGSMTVAHGAAMMVSGQDVYVGDKNGNIFVQANGKAIRAAAGAATGASAGGVTNSGTVAAPRVLLGAGDMYSTAIVNSGLLQGRSIAVNAGKNGSATVGGTLDASSAHAATATGKGGRIDVLGGTIALKGATLDASGNAGGGTVRVGGDFHGDGTLAHSTTTNVDAATTIKADATGATGDGGTVVLWSDTGTVYSGRISANAGSASGDGGQVEVSSHGGLGFTGNVLANAPGGKVGSLLLDPDNIEIVTSGAANDTEFTTGSLATTPPNPPGTITAAQGSGTYTISQNAIQSLLGNLNINLQANKDIHIDKLTGNTLTFAAPSALGNGTITFTAGSGGTTGTFAMDPTDTLVTNGRAITINAAGTGASGGINTGTYADAPTVNIANFGILTGTINTTPGGTATAGGAVTFNSTVPTTGTAPSFPVQAGSFITTSNAGAGGTITIGPAAGAFAPTSITVTGPLTTTATGAGGNGGNVLFTSSGLQNIGAVNTTSSAARGGNVVFLTTGTGGITTTAVTTTGTGAAGGGGGNVTLTSAGALNVNGAITATSTGGGSTGGNVNLAAAGLIGVTGLIDTRVAAGAGAGGNVTVRTNPTGTAGGDTLAAINTSTSGTGTAGNILIGTDGTTPFVPAGLTLNGALTAAALGTAGNGGAITLQSNGTILANTAAILNASSAAGAGGAIKVVNSGNSATFNGAVTATGPTGGGNVTMDGGGVLSLTTVDASSTGAKGGNIILGLTAPFTSITINSGGTAASSALLATGTTATAGAAAGGTVTLASSGTISVTGVINTAALGGNADAGNGGTVSVLTNQSGTPGADVLGAITTAATGTGNAGSIFLGQNGTAIFAPASLTLNGALTANAAGGGSGGTVGLASAGLISETSAIDTSVLSGAGNGGNVTILTNPSGSAGGDVLGSITTTTVGTGNAGNILIGTNGATTLAPASITLNGPLAAAATGTAGTGGAVTLVTTGAIGGSSGAISTTAVAGNAGNITATSTGSGVTLGTLTATAGGAGNGGAVTLTADGALTVGAINTTTANTGVGGAVKIYSNATSAATATPFSLGAINTSSASGVGGTITVGNLVAPAFGPTSLTLNGGLVTTGGAIDLEANATSGTITFIVPASPFRVTLTGDTTLVGFTLAISDGAATHPLNFDLTNHNLILNLSGGMTVDGAVGGTTGKFDNVNSFTSAGLGITTIDGDFSTGANQTYGSAYETLTANATLHAGTSVAGGSINFNAPLYDQTAGAHSLTLVSGTSGGVVISQPIGGTLGATPLPLGSLTATTSTTGATNATEAVTINGVAVTTTGSQAYGTLTLGGTPATALTTLSSTGGTGTISSGAVTGAGHPFAVNTVGAGSGSTFATISGAGAVDFEVGGIATFNGAITATSFSLGTTTAGTRGVFNSGGTAVSTSLGQTYNEEVYLGAATTLADSGTTTTISLKGVDSATATAQALTVNSPGTTIFGGVIGATNALASVTTDAAGTTQLNGGAVTTSGAGQVYNDPVTLGANTTLTAGTGVVTFGQTFESAGTSTTTRSLAISTSGATTFGGRVGGPVGTETGAITNAPALTSISVTGGGAVNVNGGSVTTLTGTTGTQSYSGQVVIGADTVFKGYSLTLSNGITSGPQAGTPFNLTLDLFGPVTFPGALALTGIRDFTSDGPGAVLINGDVTTTGNQSYRNGLVTIGANVILTAGTTIPTGSITLGSTVNDQTSGAHTLTLITGTSGGTTIGAAIGNSVPLQSLTATARQTTAQTTTANQPVTINATSVTTTGAQNYGALVLGGTGLTTLGGSNITSGPVTGNSNPLTVNATGSTNFGAISGAGALNFGVAGTATFASINDAASVTTTGGSAVFGPVTATGVSVSGTGSTAFNGAVNATNLTVTGGTGVTLNAGTITTSGEQNYNEPATLGSLETLSGQGTTANGGIAVRFGSTLTGPFRLVLSNVAGTGGASSDTIFGGAVGTLASLSTSAIGTTQINGGSIATSDAALGQAYNGATTLGATTLLSAGAGPINFATAGSTLNSAGVPRALTITTSGVTTFNAQVGGVLPLASLTTSTGEVDIKTGVNTQATAGGAQIYGGSVHLTGDTTLQGYSLALNGGLLGQGNSLLLNFTTQISVPGGMSGLNNFSTIGGGGAFLGGAFSTGGTQTYSGGPVVVGAASTLTSAGGNLVFNTTVDGNFALTLNANAATGQAIFNTNALVGNTTTVGAFTSNALGGTIFNMNAGSSASGKGGVNAASVTITGPVTFNEAGSTLTTNAHPSVLTTGAQTYSGAATLAQNTSLVSSGGGAIAFNAAAATVDSSSATRLALNTSTTGTQTFSGLVGAGFGLSGLTTGTGPTVFNMVIPSTNPAVVPAGVRVFGPVMTAGPVTFNVANSTTAQPSVLTLLNGAQTYGTLASPTTTVVTLAGPLTVLNSANTDSPAGTFSGGGAIVFNGNIVSASGTQALDVFAGVGTAEFDGGVTTTGAFSPGGANVTFHGSVGPLGTLVVQPNDPGVGTGSLVDLNGGTYNAATFLFSTPVTLSNDTILNSTVASGNAVVFAGALDGYLVTAGSPIPPLIGTPYSLTINLAGGNVRFGGVVGNSVPLTALTINNSGAATSTTRFDMDLSTATAGLGGVNVLGTTVGAVVTNAVTINNNVVFAANNGGGTVPVIRTGETYVNSAGGQTYVGTGGQVYGATPTSGTTVVLNTDTVLQDVSASGSIVFNDTVNGAQTLSVNANGNEVFNQLVGNTTALTSLSTDNLSGGSGSTIFDMALPVGGTAGVRTTGTVNVNDKVTFGATGVATLPTVLSGGAQTYARNATLDTSTVLTIGATGSGDITFVGRVDSGAATSSLQVNSPGNEIFQDLVGSVSPLANLSADANGDTPSGQTRFVMTLPLVGLATGIGGVNTTGTVTINDAVLFAVLNTAATHPSIASVGTQTYNGAATLGNLTILTSTAGSLAFNSTVDSDSTPRDLITNTLAAGTTTTFVQDVGTLSPLASLTTNGAGTTVLGAPATLASPLNITTVGLQGYFQPVSLGQNVVANSLSSGNITFQRAVDSDSAATPRALTVNTSGQTIFGGAVGLSNALASLTTDAAGTTQINGGSVTTSGAQKYNDAVTLGAAGAATTLASNGGGDITFVRTLDSSTAATPQALTVNTSGQTIFGGAVGLSNALASLTTDAAGTTQINGGSVTTSGAQKYNDAVTLGAAGAATTLASNGGGDITFVRTLDSSTAATPQALTVNTSGRTIFGGAVGLSNALASLTTDDETPTDLGTQINGGSVTTTGAQTYKDVVTLGATTTLASNSGGDIKFVRTLDSNTAATPQALTVNTAGRTIFGGAVGAINALASLTTDAAGTTQINGGSVTTINTGASGDQTYNDAVTLGDNTILRSTVGGAATTGGALTFNGTVDGAFTLTLNTSGVTAFYQPVGNTTALTALTTNAAGSTQFNMPVGALAGVVVTGPVTINDPVTFNVTGASLALPTILTLANGSQTYNGAVTLGTSTYLVSAATAAGGVYSGGSLIFFNSTGGVTGSGDLFVRTGSGDGNIAGSINAASVDVEGGFVNFAGPISITGNLSIASNDNVGSILTFTGGSITTQTSQTYGSAFVLGANTILTNAGDNIIFNNRVDGAFDLAVNSPGSETFNGPVGGRDALRSLTTDAAGTVGGQVIFGYAGTTAAPSVTTLNDQVYNDAATLRANIVLASRSGNITFAQTVDSATGGTFALTLNATGNETFKGRVGGTNKLASLVTDDTAGTISGGQVIFNVAGGGQTVTTTGLQRYNDAVVLQAATNLVSTNNGALTFGSTIDGAFALSLNTTGVTTFGGAVGAGTNTALTSLTTLTGEVDINGGAITTTGLQSYGGPVVLGAGATLTSTAAGGGVTFTSTVDSSPLGATPFALTISSVGPTRFLGTVGSSVPLASLTTQGAGTVQINGGAVTTTGVQKYAGAVTLGADTTLTSTAATGGGITFVSTLGSDAAATPRALTVNSVGPTKFGDVVGGSNLPLASLTAQGKGAVQINGGAVTTVGFQSYGGPVTLGMNTTLTSTANIAQAIIFNDTVDSDAAAPGSALTLSAHGDEVFGGMVGGVTPLGSLTTTNSGRVVFGINGGAVGVKTTGLQTYNNPVVLGANTTLTSTTAAGGITFASTVQRQADSIQQSALTINSVGLTRFMDVVGGDNLPLASLTTQGAGAVQINGGTVTTVGLQTYGGGVTLGADTTLASTSAGDIRFASTLDSSKGVKGAVFALTINTSGDEVFDGLIGSVRELGSLTTDGDSNTRGGQARFNMALSGNQNGVNVINNIVINDRVSFGTTGATTAATILSGGSQTYNGAATVATNTVLTGTADRTGNAFTFSTIDGSAGLTLNSHGATVFKGAIGSVGEGLGSLTVTADGNDAIFFNGGSVRTSGAQSYARQAVLGDDTTFVITGKDAANQMTFAQGLTGSGFNLMLNTSANSGDATEFDADVNVKTLTAADNSAVVLAGANVTTEGFQNYGGTLTITAPGSSNNQTVLMDAAKQSNGDPVVNSGIIFSKNVSVQAGSLVVLGNRILSGRASNFGVDAGDLVLDARDKLVLQGDSYTASGRVVLNDPNDSTYSHGDYANTNTNQPFATIYVLNSGRSTRFAGSSFDMGYLQNLFALGSVSITANGGGNAILSDISTVGSLSVTAGTITLRARDPDPTRGDGSDDGLNFVSGGAINFGQSPINYISNSTASNHANLVTSGGQVTVNRNQINGVSLFQDPTVRTRLASAQSDARASAFAFDGTDVRDLGSSFGQFFELISSGSKSQEIAAALSGALPDQKPGTDVTDNLTVTASQMEELKKLGIHPRTAQKQERLSLNSKRALFAQLVDGLDTDNYGRLQPVKGGISRLVPSDYVVVVDRMSEREVQSILTAFEELYGKNKEKVPPIRDAFNAAFTDYSTEKQTADAAGFAPYLASKPGKYPDLDKAVRGFDSLFGYIEGLGLTSIEQAKSKEHIASDLDVSGVSPEDTVKVIDTLRAKIPKSEKASSTKLPPSPPASNPAPGATNPPPPEQKKATPPLKTAHWGHRDSGRKTARQHQPAVTEDRLHEVAGL